MSNTVEPGNGPVVVPAPAANRFTPEANERIARLRVMAAEFSDEAASKALTVVEIRMARETPLVALEKAAVFAEAIPGGGAPLADAVELREAIAYELAFGSVRDEARVLARRIDQAILRRKAKAVKAARGLYRMGQGYVAQDGGDPMRPHVTEMKRSLHRPRRRKNASSPEPQLKTDGQK
jgi:hypothetical protein